MTDLPDPLTPPAMVGPEVDLRGFSGFMLNVDRLLASELVALGKPEECWAAVMLWCRAWKQSPPASLPNDDRILAAFSGSGSRWPKVKEVALRGFVLCSDGRLYHQVLADEANAAWQKRKAYKADQERLKVWRANKKKDSSETPHETGNETPGETRFNGTSVTISEPDRQGQGQGQGQRKKEDSDLRSEPDGSPPDARSILWREGLPIVRALTGQSEAQSRGFLGKMLKKSRDDCARTLQVILEAQSLKPVDPMAWLMKSAAPLGERGLLDDEPVQSTPSNPAARRILPISGTW
jgi:uncharacterized protein YdaU (DUF1376 family)